MKTARKIPTIILVETGEAMHMVTTSMAAGTISRGQTLRPPGYREKTL